MIAPNEWRKREGLAPIQGGDKLFLQQQMTPVDQLPNVDRGKTSDAAEPPPSL
jgi:hypothetical protein